MEQEATPFVEHLGLTRVEGYFPSQTPFLAFEGGVGGEDNNGIQVTVITMGKDAVYGTGVDNAGTVPASLATFWALQQGTPGSSNCHSKVPYDLVLNAGTCGGFQRKGMSIGDVLLTTGVAHHDRRIPIPGYDLLGIGQLTTMDPTHMAQALDYKTGICTTGNSLDKVDKDDELMLANDASVKDMEAAAIAWVCQMCDKTPYLGVKVVTDIVDGEIPTHEEFMANLASAATSLQQALPKILDHLSGKDIADL